MMAREFRLFRASFQHGPKNPIVVEDDDEEVADLMADEGEMALPEEHQLVPITEDPQDAALEVERADE